MKHIAKASLFLACVATPMAHAATYYVNNLSACTNGCGSSYTNGIKNLSEAIARAQPGDTVVIYGGAPLTGAAHPPYYLTNEGTPASVVPESVMNFAKLTSANTAQATTTVRAATFLPKPVIRGTMVVHGWSQVSSDSTGILYKRSWTVTKSGSSRVQEPEQVYRDSPTKPALQQVGGTVFGGYYPGVNISTIWAGLDQQSQFTAALISLNSLWPTATANKPGYLPLSGKTAQDVPILAANQFYFDNVHNELYVKLAAPLAAGEGLEVSVMPAIAANTVDYGNPNKLLRNLTLENLVFERSNTSFNARSGMVNLAGSGIKITGVEFRHGDAQCLSVQGDNNTISNSTFSHCGQIGLKVNGSDNKIQNSYFSYNNARGFEPDWEAGATKFIGGPVGLINSTISGNVLVANYGNGIWIDTDDAKGGSFSTTNNLKGNTITNNVSAFNMRGIYVELMGRVTITNNVVFGNTAQGIHLRGSPQTTVDGNVLVGNGRSGVDIEANSAGTVQLESGQPLEYTQTNMKVTNNVMGWNRESPDHIPVAANGATTLYGNTYCGTASPRFSGSLSFVLRDGGTYPTSEYAWSSWTSMGFDIAKPSQGGAASTMKIAAQPSGVTAWSTQPINVAQAGTTSSISTTRGNIKKYVTDNCK